MAEPSTVARPYAEAVFRLADDAGKLADWSAMLDALAQVAASERVQDTVSDPNLSPAQVAGTFLAILGGSLNAECENLVRVLAENRRLGLLPEIRDQFEALKNAREGVVEAEIHTARELEPDQFDALMAGLERHAGRKVKATVSVDPDLIGGVKVLIGDKVIDATARAQLTALGQALRA